MSTSQLRADAAALRAAVAALGERLAAEAAQLPAEDLFEVAGDLQSVLNAAEGAQLVATAHAASHETRLTDRGTVEVHHGVGFVDAMASSEVSLATGVGQWAAGRKVSLAAALAQRFPRLLARVVQGELACSTVQKVVTVCEGLDPGACAAVESVLIDRLAALDPSRVTTVTRRVATRVAGDQLAAAHAKNRRDRCVQVSPGPDGTTDWWARLPAARSAAAWSAVTSLGETYAEKDPSLTVDQARADAFLDLLLTNVEVTAKVTLGIPVITGEDAGKARQDADASSDRPVAVGGLGLGDGFSMSAALSGCEMAGVGWVDADSIEALLAVVPLDVGRALLDARTGTLVESVSSAYRPPRAISDFVSTRDGSCRMWGCGRPAATCDVDHARPWPNGPTSPGNLGDLCRRHHRLKQRRRWAYRLDADGTVTWTSPSGRKRVTLPDHAALPPPEPAHALVPIGSQHVGPPPMVDPPPF